MSRYDRAIPQPVPAPTKRGLSRVEAAAYAGIGASTFDKMVDSGEMPGAKHLRGRKVWDVRALDLAFEALPGGTDISDDNSWSDL